MIRGRGFHRMSFKNEHRSDEEVSRVPQMADFGVPSAVVDYDAEAFAVPTSSDGPLPLDLRHMLKQWHTLFATQVGQVLNLRGLEKGVEDG